MVYLVKCGVEWLLGVEGKLSEISEECVRAYLEGRVSVGELVGVRGAERFLSDDAALAAPLLEQEIWGAGVTYARSQAARVSESQGSASLYDKVYVAERPHLFFKGLAWKAGGHRDYVGFRADSSWSVPEPELTLVISPQGKVIGLTLGNDATARDIEASNPLYLSQVKIYEHSACFGPRMLIFDNPPDWRNWTIEMEIERDGERIFQGAVSLGQLRRSWDELVSWLYRFQDFPHGAVLLTGTGIVPPDWYSMREGDLIKIHCEPLGTLVNYARQINSKK